MLLCSARQDISSLQFRSSLSLLAPPSPCTPTVLLLLMVKHLNWMSTISRNTLFFRISRERGERNIWGIQISALVWMSSRWLSFFSHVVRAQMQGSEEASSIHEKVQRSWMAKSFHFEMKSISSADRGNIRSCIHPSCIQFWTKNLYLVNVRSLPCTFCE